MPNIQNKNYNSYSKKQKNILKLEKKYFILLEKILTHQRFTDELKLLANSINTITRYVSSNAKKVNPCDLAVQRLLQYRLFIDRSLKGKIVGIYPSTISSDVAFVTKDAVINIDTKTTRLETNKNDWNTKIVGKNQASFKHKNLIPPRSKNLVAPINFLLDKEYKNKPVLSFVLSFFYSLDESSNFFSWCRKFESNVKFASVPNGDLSKLFRNEIIDGVKQYIDPKKKWKGSSSIRISHNILKERYDENGIQWSGFSAWKI